MDNFTRNLEPRRTLWKALNTIYTFGILGPFVFSTSAIASPKGNFEKILTGLSGIKNPFDTSLSKDLVEKAQRILDGQVQLQQTQGLLPEINVAFEQDKIVGDSAGTSVKFKQKYEGLDVFGADTAVHFNSEGEFHDVSGTPLNTFLKTQPLLTAESALQIVSDRAQQNVSLSDPAQLVVMQNFDGTSHLVYRLLTRTTDVYDGQEVYIDAHTGEVVLETPRAYEIEARAGKRTIYSANTAAAHRHVSSDGAPTDINMSWYDKLIEDGTKLADIDDSARRAYTNSGKVYEYYKSTFDRRSYDGKDSRMVSVVHMGKGFNNAFWTSEYSLMAYGDGDGSLLIDTTLGLDVAAHEMTHAVTSSSANLVYAKEPGALNESFSDVFGKLVAFENDGNWYIGDKIVGPGLGRKAIRNMKNPEEFKQPGSNDSKYRVPTPKSGPCLDRDHCGVHRNSGIPNRAAVLIVESIGKEKAEHLYYNVLTKRLSSMSGFAEMRKETEKECALRFGGANSLECTAVRKAFDTVKM